MCDISKNQRFQERIEGRGEALIFMRLYDYGFLKRFSPLFVENAMVHKNRTLARSTLLRFLILSSEKMRFLAFFAIECFLQKWISMQNFRSRVDIR